MEKINNYIPTAFTLQCFCSKCCELSEGNKLHIYKLYSVITHVGATMSVGHYIAYTCALDGTNEYTNCPKDRNKQEPAVSTATSMSICATNNLNINNNLNVNSGITTTNSSSGGNITSTTGSSFMKKMKFGRNKQQHLNNNNNNSGNIGGNGSVTSLSLSGGGGNSVFSGNNESSKSGGVGVRHLNGLISGSKTITNGISKLSMNMISSNSNNAVATVASPSSSLPATSTFSSSPTTYSTPATNAICQSLDCCATRLIINNFNGNNNTLNNYSNNINNNSNIQCGNGNGLEQNEEILSTMANGNNGYVGSNNGINYHNFQQQQQHHHHHYHHHQQQHYHHQQSFSSSSSFGGK